MLFLSLTKMKMKIELIIFNFTQIQPFLSKFVAQVEEVLEASTKAGNPIVGVIVEPIQAEGGDMHGSNAWFQGLQVYISQLDNLERQLTSGNQTTVAI